MAVQMFSTKTIHLRLIIGMKSGVPLEVEPSAWKSIRNFCRGYPFGSEDDYDWETGSMACAPAVVAILAMTGRWKASVAGAWSCICVLADGQVAILAASSTTKKDLCVIRSSLTEAISAVVSEPGRNVWAVVGRKGGGGDNYPGSRPARLGLRLRGIAARGAPAGCHRRSRGSPRPRKVARWA